MGFGRGGAAGVTVDGASSRSGRKERGLLRFRLRERVKEGGEGEEDGERERESSL